MNDNKNFVAYEYKDITVKHDTRAIYTDCLSNFGWELIEEQEYGFQPIQSDIHHVNTRIKSNIHAVQSPPSQIDGINMISLKFKRDRRIDHKSELNRLERQCENALAAISSLERKNSTYTMGLSLGAGIIGAVFLGFAVYNFLSSNIILGLFLTVIGVAGWATGFFGNLKMARKKTVQAEPIIQEQLEIAYRVSEQAHALLA